MRTAAYLFYAVAQAALACLTVVLFRRRPSARAITLLLPIAAVVYDNVMVALGVSIGAGPLLMALSWPRFIGHALFTPVWLVTAVLMARDLGAFGRRAAAVTRASWVLYALMVGVGLVHNLVLGKLDLLANQGELVLYTNVAGIPGPPIPAVVMVLAVIAGAVLVGRRSGWWWMLAGGLFMFATAAVPTDVAGFLISNSGEVVLAAALVATEAFLQRRERASARAAA